MTRRLALTMVSAAALWSARRYYRNWVATKQESRAPMPGDGLIHEPAAESTDAEWIDAAAELVWPVVLDVVLRERRTAGRADPSVGDVIRLPMRLGGRALGGIEMSVVDVDDGRFLVLRTVRQAVPVDVTWTWLIEPRLDDRTRVIVRLRIALRHPGDVLLAEAAGPFIAILTRRRLAAIRICRDAAGHGRAGTTLANDTAAQKNPAGLRRPL
ncbi:SRPBCC family protein [Mycolicibacterium hodleri]|uniref:SRPBCC family protein n=1 Tax=Mycolicibacterium hodleri TaxID=49897 RepID=A0A502E4T4_9MYCO|nr:SRPBCC family protein [Mycolicibacterium hodleri]TPG32725.1 SRPBCC family protein [Mycolicibacterium hodleri]